MIHNQLPTSGAMCCLQGGADPDSSLEKKQAETFVNIFSGLLQLGPELHISHPFQQLTSSQGMWRMGLVLVMKFLEKTNGGFWGERLNLWRNQGGRAK